MGQHSNSLKGELMEFIVLKDSAIDGSFVRTGEVVTLEQEKAEAYEKALMIEPLNKPETSVEPELSYTKSDMSLVQDPTDGDDPKDELGSSAKLDTSLVQDPTDGDDPKDEPGSSTKSDKKNKQK